MIRLLAVLIVAVVSVLPSPAAAQSGDMVVHRGQEVTEDVSIAAAGEVCRRVQVKRWGETVLRKRLYTYYQQVQWCGNGNLITKSPHRTRWAEIHSPLWFFDKHIEGDTKGGRGERSYEAFTQGKFQFCGGGIKGVSCIQEALPWIRIHVEGSGFYRWKTGG